VIPADYGPAWSVADEIGDPVEESLWLEPYPDGDLESGYAAPEARYEQREAVELAFVAALQHLPAQQRAVLILRDVLGFSAAESADSLDTSSAAVNSALQRARRTVEERLPERSQQATLRELGDERSRELLHGYLDAWERMDIPAIVSMLADDVVVEMPPWPAWCQGRATVQELLLANPEGCYEAWRYVPIGANGQLAFAAFGLKDGRFEPASINVLGVRDGLICKGSAFVLPALFPRFGVPA
jgi:RNA polymerase sigma-70 factor (ECF subfamily)